MDKNLTVKGRILLFLESQGIAKSDFFKAIGFSPSNFKGENIKSKIGSDAMVKILTAYPNLSGDWLLTGRGDMLTDYTIQNPLTTPYTIQEQYTPISHEPEQTYPTLTHGAIPLVSEKAVGGIFNEYFSINEDDVLGYYVIPKFRHLGVDFMIEVSGDSMVPRFYPGDIVACSILHNPKFIQWNKSHLLATAEQGLILKRLMPSTDSECLQAVSENKDYPPFLIPKEEIKGIALVVGSIHIE